MTSRDPIDEILALVDELVDNPPAPEGDILPEYALVFKEGFLEGVSRSLKVITKYEYEKQNEPNRAATPPLQEEPMAESETSPQRSSWIWLNHDAVNAPKLKPGDLVGFEAFGWTAFGVVTRWDEDGITIREESPHPDAEQIKEFAEHTGLHLSEWQIDYLTRQLQKGHDG